MDDRRSCGPVKDARVTNGRVNDARDIDGRCEKLSDLFSVVIGGAMMDGDLLNSRIWSCTEPISSFNSARRMLNAFSFSPSFSFEACVISASVSCYKVVEKVR
jgi:hypothetical protein